ncbi:MAG: hypothetical protein HDT26_07650 [Subdoligranulum sp.]|nr:hypothetical protein [Subdoligranulum sp.]
MPWFDAPGFDASRSDISIESELFDVRLFCLKQELENKIETGKKAAGRVALCRAFREHRGKYIKRKWKAWHSKRRRKSPFIQSRNSRAVPSRHVLFIRPAPKRSVRRAAVQINA